MSNLFQLPILRMFAGVIVGVVLLFSLLIMSTFNELADDPIGNFLDNGNYERDVQYVFQLSERLGYVSESRLNFYRYQNHEGGVDNTILVFSTHESIENFSTKVERLGLPADNTLASSHGKQRLEDQYLTYVNRSDNRRIVLQDGESELSDSILSDDVSPLVTRWSFILLPQNRPKQRLIIHYAQPAKASILWKDRETGKLVNGPIVLMFLGR